MHQSVGYNITNRVFRSFDIANGDYAGIEQIEIVHYCNTPNHFVYPPHTAATPERTHMYIRNFVQYAYLKGFID